MVFPMLVSLYFMQLYLSANGLHKKAVHQHSYNSLTTKIHIFSPAATN